MPTQRLSMRRIKQLLTMRFGAGASTREIARELGVAPSTVREYLGRAAAAGIGWPLAADVTDESLMARLFVNAGVRAGARYHAEPDWSALVRELKRPGVNLLVLWEEYRAVHPEGYAYSRFCQLFREFERLHPRLRRRQKCASKARIIYGGRFHPESCRLIRKLTSDAVGQLASSKPRDKGRLGRPSDPTGRNESEV